MAQRKSECLQAMFDALGDGPVRKDKLVSVGMACVHPEQAIRRAASLRESQAKLRRRNGRKRTPKLEVEASYADSVQVGSRACARDSLNGALARGALVQDENRFISLP
jgi:hypothetical protein